MIRQDPGAASTAPAQLSRPARSLGRVRAGWALFGIAAVAAACWGVLNHPAYLEARYRRMPPEQLNALRRGRMDDPLLLYHLGRKLNQAGRFREADPFLRQAVGIEPDVARYRDEWARALLGDGRTTAAFGQLRQFAGTHPDNAEARFLLGNFYYTQRSMKRATEEFEQAVKLEPRHGDAWGHLAGARDAMGDTGGALAAAEKAVQLRPKSASYHLLLGSLLTRSGATARARPHFEKAVELSPSDGAVHRELARFLLEHGNSEERPRALEAAQKAVSLAPTDGLANLTLGRILAAAGQHAVARRPLEIAAAELPGEPGPALELARVCRRLGDGAEAGRWEAEHVRRQKAAGERQKLLAAIRVDPERPEPRRKLARLLAAIGDVAGTVHQHAMALDLPVDAPRVLMAAANDLADQRHAVEALPLARRALDVSANSPDALETLGNVYLALGQPHLAGEQYNKAAAWDSRRAEKFRKKLERYFAYLEANPTPAEQAYREARRLEHTQLGPKRMTDRVLNLALKAVELEPANRNYLWYLLRVRMTRRENPEALEVVNQLLLMSPNDSRAHAMKAYLLVDNAQTPEQFKQVQHHLEAAGKDPDSEGTRAYVRGVLALQSKQGSRAAQELRKAAELDPRSDVILYKLALAENLAGNREAAETAMKEYRARQAAKRQLTEVLGDIAQNPHDEGLYARAAKIYESHGLVQEARAIRAEAARRFKAGRGSGRAPSVPTQTKGG